MNAKQMWTIVALVLSLVVSANAQGVSLLDDSDFNGSVNSVDLRADSVGQDWYESRQDVPTLVTLDLTNVGGNATKKAKLTPSTVGGAHLTQEFSSPQTQQFAAQWDIYVDSILDRPDSIYDRAAWVFIGDDTGTTPDRIGPNAEDSERFVYLGFYKAGGGTSGTMDLVARERSVTATTFKTVATGLSLKRWYTIRVFCDLAQDTYEVYIDGQLQGTVKARTPKSSVTHISCAQWTRDEGAATFYVDNVMAECDPYSSFLDDSDFNASIDSADLRVDAGGQDWYESRQDAPSLVTLNFANIGGNNAAKAAFAASSTRNTYLTQEFSQPITETATAQWDIYVASILNLSADPDRGAWMLIGDDTGTTPERTGPNAEDSERFVYLGFYKNGGGSSGTMDLVARDRDDDWDSFTTVASNLNMRQWYTIGVSLNLLAGTYEVYVDGEYKATVTSRHPKSSVTHISFAQWDDGAGSFYVDNVTAESSAADQSSDDRVYDVAIQSDGKIVAVGERIASGHGDFAVARYNTDGSLDLSFSGDGRVTTDNALGPADAECVIIQPDGKIIAAGAWYDDSELDRDFALVRYRANGSLDPTFGGDGIVTTDFGSRSWDHIYDIALQPDGKIVVVGMSLNHSSGDRWDFALARYDRFGNLDPTFSGDGKVITPIGTDMDMAQSVAIRPDGKIVVAGYTWDEVNWDYELALARYNANGSPDLSFSGDGKQIMDISSGNDLAQSMVLQPDGKIVLAGSSFDGSRDAFLLARYNPDGSQDASFMGAGILRLSIGPYDDRAYSVALQPDGKIVAAGYSLYSGDNYLDFALVRCNRNGSLDESFGVHGMVTTDFASSYDWAYGVALQSDGKIVLAGYTAEFEPPESYDAFDFALTRYNTDGSLDLSFSGDGKVTTNFP